MADKTTIEWTDATWNPITGCSRAGEGCRHCYAALLAATRLKHHPSRAGLAAIDGSGEAKFNGQVRFNEQWLADPLKWRRPRMVFVCAHADLFHENVPDAWIDRVFAVMALCPQHTFQVLTKRGERMREYVSEIRERYRARPYDLDIHLGEQRWPGITADQVNAIDMAEWPLPNVWLGVSVEDQAAADARIPDLLATPAAVRWLSCEPLLGALDLTAVRMQTTHVLGFDALAGKAIHKDDGDQRTKWTKLDWVVCGGESGAKARPMHPDWARGLRDQCADAWVPFFFKQWGEWGPTQDDAAALELSKIGKKKAGRLLDEVTHDAMPQVPA